MTEISTKLEAAGLRVRPLVWEAVESEFPELAQRARDNAGDPIVFLNELSPYLSELLAARKKLAELEAAQFQARVELHATVRKLNCDNADEFWAAIGRIRARAETAEARAEAAEATVERLRAALEAYEHFPEARAALQESTDG